MSCSGTERHEAVTLKLQESCGGGGGGLGGGLEKFVGTLLGFSKTRAKDKTYI